MRRLTSHKVLTPGGSSFESAVPDIEKQVFQKAIRALPGIGVDYTPLAYSCQIVNGLNYCFLCKRKAGTGPEQLALAYVYYHASHGVAPLIRLKKIVSLQPSSVLYLEELE